MTDDRDAFRSELNVSWSRVSQWKNTSEVRYSKITGNFFFIWNYTNEDTCSSLKLLFLALHISKACELESVHCSKSSAQQKHTDSIISGIEVIEENISDGTDKLQSEQLNNTKPQSSSFKGLYFHHMPHMFQMHKLASQAPWIYLHILTVEKKYY